MSDELTGTTYAGWTVGEKTVVPYKGGFASLYRCTRACRECGTEMVLNASKDALTGVKKNNGLSLGRCLECRQRRKASSGLYRGAAPQPAADEIETVEVAATPGSALDRALTRNDVLSDRIEALIRENAELRAAAKFAVAPSPQPAAAPLADTAELESLRKLRAYVEQRWFQQGESSPSVDDMIEELDEARDQQLRWRKHYAAEVAKSLAAKGFGVG